MPATRPSSATSAFTATRWSLVLRAADTDAPASARALEELARAYWFPLYAYVRHRGHSADLAEDLTQEFFARLLDKNYLADADRSKGKFRCFLLASLKHFLANEWDKRRSVKRGGRHRTIPLNSLEAEARYALEPVDRLTPEVLFERRWALAVLDQVLNRLREYYVQDGKAEFFEAIKQTLTGDPAAGSYAQIADQLNMTEGAVKVAAHRLRSRYRELLREEIAQTVESPEQVDEEIGHLLQCL